MSTFYSAILLMGGMGRRFGSSLPKQFHRIAGKPVYLYTLEKFLEIPKVSEIILPVPESQISEIQKTLETLRTSIPIKVITGGTTRQESSYRALLACNPNCDFVIIHDAVRPFVSSEIIFANLSAVVEHKAVDTCIPSTDTLVCSSQGKWIDSIPRRSHYLRGQTPQSFLFSLILSAHEKAKKEEIFDSSDDCSLVLRLGHPVHIVQGSEENSKITTELDLSLAEQRLRLPKAEAPHVVDTPSLQGKIYAITGGTGGIGSAICKKLEQEGARCIVLSLSSPFHPVDLTDVTQVETMFQKIHASHGPLDGLINCIGAFTVKPFYDMTHKEIEHTIATNFTSILYSCKYAIIKPKGHIINIASSSYTKGRKEYLVYSAAKAAVVNFTQGLAETLPELQIHALVPQRTNTKMRRDNFPYESSETLLDPIKIAEKTTELLKQTRMTGSIIEIRKVFADYKNGKDGE